MPSLGRMLLLRSPLALASILLGYWQFQRAYQGLRGSDGALVEPFLRYLPGGLSAGEWRAALADLPSLPGPGRVLPWLAVAAPLGVIGLWLHDAAWDHGCLWMLGGLRQGRGLGATLIAEAEALSVGAVGAVLGLVGFLPDLGSWLALPLLALGAWFWVLRGFALAAWHDCPVWKGLAATLLHALLAACCAVGLLGFSFVLLVAALA